MKKFVSIVIALVMVLSMTSAFAWTLDCGVNGFNWACPTDATNCAKATVEVVPYVKVNTACNGWEYQQSDCAAAINTENVYFALKMTVPADTNWDWYNVATVTFESAGLTGVAEKAVLDKTGTMPDTDEDGWILYWDGSKWVDSTEVADFDIADVIIPAKVANYSKAKVCLTIESENDGIGTFTWGNYKVTAGTAQIKFVDKDDDRNTVTIDIVKEKVNAVNYTGNIAFYNSVVADFNLNACTLGTCITAKTIQANFGWDDKQEDCFAWSGEGASVVNPECSVEIPKTGDVSVVAYAVMAIVAAAGTMLKK